MIEKIEVSMTNENIHNFKKGEFGVESINIDESRGFIEVVYSHHEIGTRYVLLPLQNVEKCDYLVKNSPKDIDIEEK
ncbi:hypothetical protein HYG87_08880 [Methanobacterium alkalithermotolerans]|uniref:Uncharacterized protein n=1 Tax=Methanobacterium alkalithermotolerans TaxID=2731220 RepID=A0A8T8K5K6_9EURY|nr:hypothetical protein [Methanobacterium alkalithermotolerans]QUH23866.1 hypothetical protein HYG87_08880 [Methanobacterium alkalithermotolerans]RJS48308.1 MAG: hypothetical protein CIT03_08715 [Methanobacterium sp.]